MKRNNITSMLKRLKGQRDDSHLLDHLAFKGNAPLGQWLDGDMTSLRVGHINNLKN